MKSQMTPEIALANLDLASSFAQGTRKDHQGIMESVEVLRALIEASKVKPVEQPSPAE